MSTLAQTTDNDLALTQGQLTIVSNPAEAAAIKLANKFKSFLGEWFLDTRLGIPYFQTVFIKNPDLNLVGQIFRQTILSTPPINEVIELHLVQGGAGRTLSFDFKARTNTGAIITGGSGVPFIVQVP